jgi:hypothetical protein
LPPPDFESGASTSFATPALISKDTQKVRALYKSPVALTIFF